MTGIFINAHLPKFIPKDINSSSHWDQQKIFKLCIGHATLSKHLTQTDHTFYCMHCNKQEETETPPTGVQCSAVKDFRKHLLSPIFSISELLYGGNRTTEKDLYVAFSGT